MVELDRIVITFSRGEISCLLVNWKSMTYPVGQRPHIHYRLKSGTAFKQAFDTDKELLEHLNSIRWKHLSEEKRSDILTDIQITEGETFIDLKEYNALTYENAEENG